MYQRVWGANRALSSELTRGELKYVGTLLSGVNAWSPIQQYTFLWIGDAMEFM
jgi:hypothetical protein